MVETKYCLELHTVVLQTNIIKRYKKPTLLKRKAICHQTVLKLSKNLTQRPLKGNNFYLTPTLTAVSKLGQLKRKKSPFLRRLRTIKIG